MEQELEQINAQNGHKKNKISYWNSIFSISTVLFFTGFLSLFIWIFKQKSDILKESVHIQVELIDTNYQEYLNLINLVKTMPAVKDAAYISKDSAAIKLKREINEDFVEILGYNPLFNSLDINIKADFFQNDILEEIKNKLETNYIVRDVNYPKNVSKALEKNMRKFSIYIGAIALFLLIIAIILIDSTIRLAMYSDRFIIKSMQLVGATKWFIIKPYIIKSILNGIFSAFLAISALLLIMLLISKYTDVIDIVEELDKLALIFGGLVFLGISISSLSTFFAVHKYLRTKLDNLF
ncbi:MAG: permease-like cell division protein FtsX [Chitinophagales bacterium]|jgi:cell division transport system permease protein|nr:permease-like cell division protein FtsX [Chitinophagales bacterium]